MFSKRFLVVLATSAIRITATPTTSTTVQVNKDLRLIKTSELDPGTWVTDEEKIVNYVAKNIYFIDVTDITVRMFASLVNYSC